MSFKIKINNEEVVSDSNLQIKEEMLSTSSTILKNCYPKSWEDDKDYTTKYYFPKDYSKCKIVDETYHPESLGIRVTGTNLHINYDNNKYWDLEELQGNTYQQTYTGKNLLKNTNVNSGDNNYWEQYSTFNQITGELTRSTTATTESYITHRINGIKNSTKYTISFMAKSNGKVKNMDIYFFNRQTQGICSTRNITLTTTYQKYTFTFTTDSSTDYSTNSVVRIDNNGSTTSGTTATLTIKDVMLVEGEDTNFEPYVGGTPSPNPDYPQAIQNVTGRQTIDVVGKNLYDKDKSCNYKSNNDVVETNINTGKKISWKSATSSTYKFVDYAIMDLTNFVGKTIRFKCNFNASGSNTGQYYIGLCDKDGNNRINKSQTTTSGTTLNFTVPELSGEQKYLCLVLYVNTTGTLRQNDYVEYTNMMLTVDDEDMTYEPYIGQSYEINLGKNLFDKDNVNVLNGFFNNGNIQEALSGQKTIYIPCKPNTTYTMSKIVSDRFQLAYANQKPTINSSVLGTIVDYTTPSITITTGNQAKYLVAYCYTGTDTISFENMLDTIQIETGSQATSYSEYFTPIELNKIGNYQDSIKKSTGKNLFDGIYYNAFTSGGSPYTFTSSNTTRSGIIKVEGNTTYTISKELSNRFRISEYTEYPVVGTSNAISYIYPNNNDSTLNWTFTTKNATKYLVVQVTNSSEENVKMQIEKGNQATPYEPYLPIGTWYIEKKIGKVVFDGTENWTKRNNGDGTNTISFTHNMLYGAYGTNNEYCDRFNYEQSSTSGKEGIGSNSTLDQYYIQIKRSRLSSLDATGFKTWLSSNNVEVLYVLSTPTYTEITNTDLINQLESIELLNGINNIMVSSGDLAGDIKIFYNYKEAYITEDIIFCGCVKNTGNISLNPREPHYVDLQVLDFKTLLSEGETLNYVITGKTIVEAINQVVASISDYGFIVGNIELLNPNDIINAYSTLNKTAYDVFQYIADITQSKWTTRLIDENTIAIDFYDPTLMPQAEPILNTKEYMCSHKINDISFNYSTNDYRNKQIMTSDEVFANITQTETLTADGYSKNFICQNKIGKITSITVNGVESSFVTKSEDELGLSGDFVYQPGENQFTSKNTISSGSIIVITYYAIVKGREIILNSTESSRISNQIGRKGTISRYENRNDTTSSLELQKIGQSYIKYKGNAEITLKVISENDLFNVGQIVNYDAPLNELKTDYMVKTKLIDMYLNANKIFYSYELSNNFNSENAINYFDNQRAKNQGNIGEGETITRNIDIETTSSIIFYETNIEEVEVSNPTSLDFALDGVLI